MICTGCTVAITDSWGESIRAEEKIRCHMASKKNQVHAQHKTETVYVFGMESKDASNRVG